MMRSVKVTVAGQTLALRTDATPDYVAELAALVSARVEEAREHHASRRPASTTALALLAAIHLADELAQLRAEKQRLERAVRDRSRRILQYLDQARGA